MINVSGETLTLVASIIAVAISSQFNNDDLNTLSCLLNAIADNICIITSQRTAIKNSENTS